MNLNAALDYTTCIAVGSSGCPRVEVDYTIAPDQRNVVLHRPGAVGEWVDSNGDTHGDTTYSYYSYLWHMGQKEYTAQLNTQIIYPTYGQSFDAWGLMPGYVYGSTTLTQVPDVTFTWSPSNSVDTWDHAEQQVPYGAMEFWSNPFTQDTSRGIGDLGPTGTKTMTITYHVTSNTDGAQDDVHYYLTMHDQFDNWNAVDAFGNPGTAANFGDPAPPTLIASVSAPMPTGPAGLSITYNTDQPASWTVAEVTGGGVLAGAGIVVAALDVPTWPAVALALAGTSLSTVGSLPVAQTTLNTSPITLADFTQAYNNAESGTSAAPGTSSNGITMASSLAQLINWNGGLANIQSYWNGSGCPITETVNAYQKNWYHHSTADKWNEAGLVMRGTEHVCTIPNGVDVNIILSN